jgi:hypothetical protein
MQESKMIRGIVIDQVNGRAMGRGPYRNIKNTGGSIRQFKKVMKSMFPNASHINFYDSKKVFLFQEKWLSSELKEKKVKRLNINYLSNTFLITGQDRKLSEIILSQWDPL